YVFFFQAEDGIRDFHVTGVQTCALPISKTSTAPSTSSRMPATPDDGCICAEATCMRVVLPAPLGPSTTQRSPSSTRQLMRSSRRSEERRVGKEWGSRGAPDQQNRRAYDR